MGPPEMRPDLELKIEQKIDRIQEDVNQLEVCVGNLQGEQKRTATDITGMRNEMSELRRELGALRTWLNEHVFGLKRPQ